MGTTLIGLIVIAVVVVYIVFIYNRLVSLRNQFKTSGGDVVAFQGIQNLVHDVVPVSYTHLTLPTKA